MRDIKVNRATKYVIGMVIDILAVCLAAYFASLLVINLSTIYKLKVAINATLVVNLCNIVLVLILFNVFNIYSLSYKNVGLMEALKLAGAIIIVIFADLMYYWIIGDDYINAKWIFVNGFLLFSLLLVSRFWYRATLNIMQYFRIKTNGKERVMIIGAGDAGTMLVREMRSGDFDKNPVCLIDDDPLKQGIVIHGTRVVGNRDDIAFAVKKYRIDTIIVAIPSADKDNLSRVIMLCKDTGCKVKIVPSINEIVEGTAVNRVRDVDVVDLLGRAPTKVNLEEIAAYITNRTVLVTGGGGSIGSELCRQIAERHPSMLIIVDIYENNAYDIQQELVRKHPELKLEVLIASVRDSAKMNDLFKKYKIDIVFHAAAHKHVPLMEDSPNEAVKNNVCGTLKVARAASANGVKKFVMISSDKAVNPTNIMGATKRICEMIIQTMDKHSETEFVAVRFGNVLGSNGSVVPLFKKQIAEGGPVTVTHKDVIRYFMTISEAVSLVLQAGAYARGGEIFVLNMGEPVRIYDLAYNLIKLSGFEPEKDVKIEITGLRKGEKLYEERLMREEGLQTTANELISIGKPLDIDEDKLFKALDELYKEAYAETDHMKQLVKELVPTYKIDGENQ